MCLRDCIGILILKTVCCLFEIQIEVGELYFYLPQPYPWGDNWKCLATSCLVTAGVSLLLASSGRRPVKAAPNPTVHRTAAHNKGSPSPKVSSAELEKLFSSVYFCFNLVPQFDKYFTIPDWPWSSGGKGFPGLGTGPPPLG